MKPTTRKLTLKELTAETGIAPVVLRGVAERLLPNDGYLAFDCDETSEITGVIGSFAG